MSRILLPAQLGKVFSGQATAAFVLEPEDWSSKGIST